MPKKPRARPSLPDRFCEAIKELTAERQTRTYAVQWIMVHSVARHLGISDEEAQEARSRLRGIVSTRERSAAQSQPQQPENPVGDYAATVLLSHLFNREQFPAASWHLSKLTDRIVIHITRFSAVAVLLGRVCGGP